MEHPRIQNLGGGDWRLGYLKGHTVEPPARVYDTEAIQRWVPARVPGNVRADLMRSGVLPDLYYGDESGRHDWVDDCLWWYEKEVPIRRRPRTRLFVDFRGVDYRSVVFWNQSRLGANEGMFSRQLYEVTHLVEETNLLRVRIAGSRYLPRPELSRLEAWWQPLATKLQGLPAFPERFGTVKCQMSYGWDFAPALRTMGIWDDVFLHTSGAVFLERMALSAELAEGFATADLGVRVATNTAAAGEYTLEVSVAGDTCEAPAQTFRFPAYLQAGREVIERRVTVRQPQLWHTWDRGPQALYRVTVRVLDGSEVVHELHERFGFREVRMVPNPGAPARVPEWTFEINGEALFVRGANWVPADSLPGRVEPADYAELLTLAREAHINMLRVWGGGLREKAVFYDVCAELGILVWQEFPFACAFLDRFQRTPDFLALVEKEVSAIVKTLQNAPAVAVYCGGNEFSPRRNEPVVETLRRVVTSLDPQRPFFAASPREGAVHNWFVWHHYASPLAYEETDCQFYSEFGLQALPDLESLVRFLPKDALWPPGDLWTHHCAQLSKLERYAGAVAPYGDLAGMIHASQRAQAFALQIGIEHARLRKPACSGVMFWQFNEPWPAISWSVVDFFRRPKLGYAAVRRAYAPVLACVRFSRRRYRPGETVSLEVWMVNDTPATLTDCRVEVFMRGEEGRAFSMAFTIDTIAADSAARAFDFDLVLPARPDLTLYVDLSRDGSVLATNEYDLGVLDEVQAKPLDELRYRIMNRLLA